MLVLPHHTQMAIGSVSLLCIKPSHKIGRNYWLGFVTVDQIVSILITKISVSYFCFCNDNCRQ